MAYNGLMATIRGTRTSRIGRDDRILGGVPIIRGTRLPVRAIVQADGTLRSIEWGSSQWPSVNPERARQYYDQLTRLSVSKARTKIVEGAVGMVQMALDHLAKDKIVDLDDERRAQMVSNLLVVLCSDRHTQPVVNTGSLY